MVKYHITLVHYGNCLRIFDAKYCKIGGGGENVTNVQMFLSKVDFLG